MNKLFSIVIFCFLSCFTQAAPSKIGDYIENLLTLTFSVLNDQNINMYQKKEKIQVLLSQNLDFDYMAKKVLAVGSTNSMDIKDFVDFKSVYTKYILVTYSNAVKNYNGQKIHVKTVTKNSLGNYIVQTIMSSNGSSSSIDINYQVFEDSSGNFKIQDMITEGVSLLSTHRADFGSVISHGPNHNIRDLTQKLKAMTN